MSQKNWTKNLEKSDRKKHEPFYRKLSEEKVIKVTRISELAIKTIDTNPTSKMSERKNKVRIPKFYATKVQRTMSRKVVFKNFRARQKPRNNQTKVEELYKQSRRMQCFEQLT